MTKHKCKSNLDGTLKRVHIEVSDSSLSDEEPMSHKQASSKKSKIVSSNWSRSLVISSSDEGALKTLLPFVIQKGLIGLAGEPNHVTKFKKRVTVGRVFERQTLQMSSQVDFTRQCVNQCLVTFLP